MKPFEILDSTSELRLRVVGVNYRELVKKALLGMFSVVDPTLVNHTQQAHTIYVTAPNRELLLIDFLQHALGLAATHREAFSDVHFASISDTEFGSDQRSYYTAFKGFEPILRNNIYDFLHFPREHGLTFDSETTFPSNNRSTSTLAQEIPDMPPHSSISQLL